MPPATGPYMTQSIRGALADAGSHRLATSRTWTLVRNPRFHEWSHEAQPSGFPDKIVLSQGQSVDRAVNAITSHRLDVLYPVPSSRLGDLAAHYTGQFHSEPARATFGQR